MASRLLSTISMINEDTLTLVSIERTLIWVTSRLIMAVGDEAAINSKKHYCLFRSKPGWQSTTERSRTKSIPFRGRMQPSNQTSAHLGRCEIFTLDFWRAPAASLHTSPDREPWKSKWLLTNCLGHGEFPCEIDFLREEFIEMDLNKLEIWT